LLPALRQDLDEWFAVAGYDGPRSRLFPRSDGDWFKADDWNNWRTARPLWRPESVLQCDADYDSIRLVEVVDVGVEVAAPIVVLELRIQRFAMTTSLITGATSTLQPRGFRAPRVGRSRA
jgi:hypothetical protein